MQETPIAPETVNILSICPKCHTQIKPTDYFCFNCGTNLHPAPLSTSVTQQIMYYMGSLILPPMGIIWGARYLKQSDSRSKLVGIACIILTVLEILLVIQAMISFMNAFNSQMNSTFQNIGGL